MDIVITYVNGLDPKWQEQYKKHNDTPMLEKRFRDWGTLKFLFRGIEQNMSFIDKVFLVVSDRKQIPEWMNTENVRIVLHSDIIPGKYIPTFNSNTIEMFLHRIEGLDEQFLYFNDDMFPIAPACATDFFRKGKAVIKFTKHYIAYGMFKQICRNSDRLAHKVLGIKPPCSFMRPQHICSPMLRSSCREVYNKAEKDILESLTTTRSKNNFTQYLFLDYMYLTGKVIDEKIDKRHFSTAITSPGLLSSFIQAPTKRLICINDVCLGKKRYAGLRSAVIEAFEKRFPQKSKYEL